MSKHPFIFLILTALFLAACGGADGTLSTQPTTQLPEPPTRIPTTSPATLAPTETRMLKPQPGSFWAALALEEQEGSASLTFKVSQDSTSISNLSLMLTNLQCEGFKSGFTILQTTSSLPVQEGKFKGSIPSIGEIEGEFTSPTSLRGQVHLLLDFGLGGEPIECGTSGFDGMLMPEKSATTPGETPTTPTQPTSQASTSLPAYAGKTFTGPLEGGIITFTVATDGLSIESGAKMVLKDVGCAEGGPVSGGFSKIDTEITLGKPVPIEDGKFHYGSLKLNPFEEGSGTELIGQFDSDTSTSGTFGMDVGDSMNHCTLGPFGWTATSAAPTEQTQAIPTGSPPLLTPRELPGGEVAVINVYSTEKGDDLYILGEVENRASGYIANLRLNVTIFDTNGKQTAKGEDHAKHDELAPGERGPFIITIPKPTAYSSFNLEVDYDKRGSSPPPELRIVDQVIERDASGMVQASGMVENGTSEYLQYVMIVGVFYDVEGRVIGVGSNFVVGPDQVLVPGKRAPFQFYVDPFNMGEYADYRLIMTNNGYPVDKALPEFQIGSVETGPGSLTGKVTFPGPGSAGLTTLWIATFDNQGKLIEVASSYIVPDTLGAGESGTFEFNLRYPQYATYELYSEYFAQ